MWELESPVYCNPGRQKLRKHKIITFHFLLHSAKAAALGGILIYHFIIVIVVSKTNTLIYKNKVTNEELTTAVPLLGDVAEQAKRFSIKSVVFSFRGVGDEKCSGFLDWHIQVAPKRKTFLLAVYCISNQTVRLYFLY